MFLSLLLGEGDELAACTIGANFFDTFLDFLQFLLGCVEFFGNIIGLVAETQPVGLLSDSSVFAELEGAYDICI